MANPRDVGQAPDGMSGGVLATGTDMPKDPRRSALALSYDRTGNGAPRVVAKGYGLIADTIIARAREGGLYVHEAPEMVSMLMHVGLDREIPPALYQVVAELLGWLYSLESAANGRAVSASYKPTQR
jgi:flagellar biosynthesis protein